MNYWDLKRATPVDLGSPRGGGRGSAILGLRTEEVEEARDIATADVVARYQEFIQVQDYWIVLFDRRGGKVLDTVVRGRVIEMDEEGELLIDEGTGSPALQVFLPTEMRDDDLVTYAEALADGEVQAMWKVVDDGTYEPEYAPRVERKSTPDDGGDGSYIVTAVFALVALIIIASC